jgi:hypothetical protein
MLIVRAPLPAIRQQPSLTTPYAASCRFDVVRVLSSTDVEERVDEWWGVRGRLVNGMQGVRGSNPLSSTRHNASAGHPLRVVCQQIVSRSRHVAEIAL